MEETNKMLEIIDKQNRISNKNVWKQVRKERLIKKLTFGSLVALYTLLFTLIVIA